jgi:undecaprenyl-diphosphatase
MDFIQSIILGIVQGLSEFLPISSSGHLVILPWIFHWQDQGLAFDVALHLGTLLAVLAYFRKEWMMMFKAMLFQKNIKEEEKELSVSKQGKKSQISNLKSQICLVKYLQSKFNRVNSKFQNPNYYQQFNRQLFFFILLASIPGAFFGWLFQSQAENIFRSSPLLIVFTLSGAAFFLWWFDKKGKKEKFLKNLNWHAALFIGFSQALAIIPGVSRSGVTITAALALGFERKTVAKFSFLLAAPIIFGAGLVKIPSLINNNNINFSVLLIGILTSAIAGFLAIKYLLRYLETRSYNIFVYYRIILALAILGIILMR